MATPLFFAATALLDARDEELKMMVRSCTKSRMGVYYIPTTGFLELSALQSSKLVAKLSRIKLKSLIDPVTTNPEPVLDGVALTKLLLEANLTEIEIQSKSSSTKNDENVEAYIKHGLLSPRGRVFMFEESLGLERRILELQRQAHQYLEQDGCRPMIPFSLIKQGIYGPVLFEGQLRPWKDDWCYEPTGNSLILDNRSVLHRQLIRWRDFRDWQYHTHFCKGPKEVEFDPYLTARRAVDEAGGLQLRQETWPFYIEHISMAWAQEKNARESRRKTWTKKQCPSFDQHVSELQDRLARHGCETDLVPSHDPRHQPEVLTWMEYLIFESLLLEDWNASAEKLQHQRQDDWMDLYLEDYILSGDTPEMLASRPVVLEQIQRAEADVEEANEQISKFKQVSKSEPWCSMISRKEKNALRGRWVGILKAAETRQRGARKALSKIDAFLEVNKALIEYKKKRDHQAKLVGWILKQIKIIETEASAHGVVGVRGKKRKVPAYGNEGYQVANKESHV